MIHESGTILLIVVGMGGTTTTMAYNSDDQLCWSYVGTSSNSCSSAPSGSTTYSFDANGNQTSSSAGESLSYNPINQTTSMTPAGGSALAMGYTGVDSTLRTSVGSTTETNNVFGPASATTGTTTTWFTRDPGGQLNSVLVGSTRYYVYYDGAGSIAGLINGSGSQVASFSYDPYGNTNATGSEASVDPIRFQGGWEDSSGFYKFGTRYENPNLGSWTQEDPASINYLEGYQFDENDPINNIDPFGQSWFTDVLSTIAGALTGVITGVTTLLATDNPALAAAVGACVGGGASIAYHELINGQVSKLTLGTAALNCLRGVVQWARG
jgi:RHS repeat-associated protein